MGPAVPVSTDMPAVCLPKVNFAGRMVTRMFIGGNPFSGVAHRPEDPSANQRLKDYFTDAKVVETLKIAVGAGINGFHGRGDENVFRWLGLFRTWAAAQAEPMELNWLAQTAPDRYIDGKVEPNIDAVAPHGPLAIYIHGGTSDSLFAEGRLEYLRDLIAYIKGKGFFAGLGAHNTRVIRTAEEQDWGAQFYVTPLRHDTYSPHICPNEEESAALIKSIAKPFVAIKTLASGRLFPEWCFRYTSQTLKPSDIASVGMHDYEVLENVRLAAKWFARPESGSA